MPPKMHAFQIKRPNGPLERVEREIPTPPSGFVRMKVHTCGVCHSDVFTVEGSIPGTEYPRVPGHEVIGVIDAVGAGVTEWQIGQRVGVGWHGGYCGHCDQCRQGHFFACVATQVTGLNRDGGYADYMIAPTTALARVPDQLSDEEAAPLMCAGVTTFNALRNSGTKPGDLVAILGVGGLGHLGIQFAAKMGLETVAIARGEDKKELALKLGAKHYIDSQSKDPSVELTRLGGAKAVLATVTQGDAMTASMGGLSVNGRLMVIGAPPTMSIIPYLLIAGRRAIQGWYSGTSIDSEETLAFSVLSGVRPMNEVFPMQKANEAFERMKSGAAKFRVVLKS